MSTSRGGGAVVSSPASGKRLMAMATPRSFEESVGSGRQPMTGVSSSGGGNVDFMNDFLPSSGGAKSNVAAAARPRDPPTTTTTAGGKEKEQPPPKKQRMTAPVVAAAATAMVVADPLDDECARADEVLENLIAEEEEEVIAKSAPVKPKVVVAKSTSGKAAPVVVERTPSPLPNLEGEQLQAPTKKTKPSQVSTAAVTKKAAAAAAAAAADEEVKSKKSRGVSNGGGGGVGGRAKALSAAVAAAEKVANAAVVGENDEDDESFTASVSSAGSDESGSGSESESDNASDIVGNVAETVTGFVSAPETDDEEKAGGAVVENQRRRKMSPRMVILNQLKKYNPIVKPVYRVKTNGKIIFWTKGIEGLFSQYDANFFGDEGMDILEVESTKYSRFWVKRTTQADPCAVSDDEVMTVYQYCALENAGEENSFFSDLNAAITHAAIVECGIGSGQKINWESKEQQAALDKWAAAHKAVFTPDSNKKRGGAKAAAATKPRGGAAAVAISEKPAVKKPVAAAAAAAVAVTKKAAVAIVPKKPAAAAASVVVDAGVVFPELADLPVSVVGGRRGGGENAEILSVMKGIQAQLELIKNVLIA